MTSSKKTRKHCYAISRGRCAPSVISSWLEAAPEVTGYKNNKYKGFEDFKDAREWLSKAGHDTFHFYQGPGDGDKSKTDEHSGQPECYVVSNGRDAALYERYSDVKAHTAGVRNATQKSYATRKTAEAVLHGLGKLSQGIDLISLDGFNVSDKEESLVTRMANVSLQNQ